MPEMLSTKVAGQNTGSVNAQKKNTEELVELAAEQLAILLWKTWLHNKKRREEGKKDEKSS